MLSEVQDYLAKTVRSTVRVSAYPLAYWFAYNWWRLNCELGSSDTHRNLDWLLSHNVASVGEGYIWPRISISPYGEDLFISMHPSEQHTDGIEPIRYLTSVKRSIPRLDFEEGVMAFVTAVLARLDARGMYTDLHRLWTELTAERDDRAASTWRTLEAILGFDPDEAPGNVIESLIAAVPETGLSAIEEIAAADKNHALKTIEVLRSVAGHTMQSFRAPKTLGLLRSKCAIHWKANAHPWERGVRAAQLTREAWFLDSNPLENSKIEELVGFQLEGVQEINVPRTAVLGLGVEQGDNGHLKVLLSARHPHGRRFEFARLLGDFMFLNQRGGAWKPVTKAKTARQQFQRAFAAELLCPIAGVHNYLSSGSIEDEDIEDIATEYNVAFPVVENQLMHNGLLASREPYPAEYT